MLPPMIQARSLNHTRGHAQPDVKTKQSKTGTLAALLQANTASYLSTFNALYISFKPATYLRFNVACCGSRSLART